MCALPDCCVWHYEFVDCAAGDPPAGVPEERLEYGGWGNLTNEPNVGYAGTHADDGYRWEASTGMYQTPARCYDPAVGRWISQEPLGCQPGDDNCYPYARPAEDLADRAEGREAT